VEQAKKAAAAATDLKLLHPLAEQENLFFERKN